METIRRNQIKSLKIKNRIIKIQYLSFKGKSVNFKTYNWKLSKRKKNKEKLTGPHDPMRQYQMILYKYKVLKRKIDIGKGKI